MYRKVFFTTLIISTLSMMGTHLFAQNQAADCTISTKTLMNASQYNSREWRISRRWVYQQELLQNKINLAIDEKAKEKIVYVLSSLRLKMPKASSDEILDEYNELFTRCL